MDKKYEDFLNAFIKNVGEKTAAYKARRAVMADLVKPENLKNPKYVEENEVMMRSLSVELNKQMDDIMRAFKDADIEMNKMTTGRPEAERKNTLQAWDNLKERQGQSYVALFTAEEDIIKAYQNLMDFYYERRGIFVYDGQGELIFQNQISKTQETALIKAIADMTAQEAQLNKH